MRGVSPSVTDSVLVSKTLFPDVAITHRVSGSWDDDEVTLKLKVIARHRLDQDGRTDHANLLLTAADGAYLCPRFTREYHPSGLIAGRLHAMNLPPR